MNYFEFKEQLRLDWKYDRSSVLKRAAVLAAAVIILIFVAIPLGFRWITAEDSPECVAAKREFEQAMERSPDLEQIHRMELEKAC